MYAIRSYYAINKNNEIHHFKLNVNQTQFENEPTPYIVVTLTDITRITSYNVCYTKLLRMPAFRTRAMLSSSSGPSNITTRAFFRYR